VGRRTLAALDVRRAASAMSDDTVIAEWPLNRRERARISIEQFNGTWLINARKWFEADDGSLRPGKHSAKPLRYYELIEAYTPGLIRLEGFSRLKEPRPGWVFWGNEAPTICRSAAAQAAPCSPAMAELADRAILIEPEASR
jgi:hypothetical protein